METLTRRWTGSTKASSAAASPPGVRCAVRVYERYSLAGGNRLSLTLTLLGQGEELFLSAIAAGGSQGMFLKLNTFGEESFLEKVRELAERL